MKNIYRLGAYVVVDHLRWLTENSIEFDTVETAVHPFSFETLPYKIKFCNEEDEMLYVLRWA